jgi:hypothetical protein
MAYGQQGSGFYVNSSQRVSRDVVDEKFGRLSKGDGSVPLRHIETITGGADLKGNWAIRSYIEETLLPAGQERPIPAGQVRFAQRSAARRQAQRIRTSSLSRLPPRGCRTYQKRIWTPTSARAKWRTAKDSYSGQQH